MLNSYINNSLINSITLLSQNENVPVSTVLAASFNIVLQRYSGQEDVFLDQSFINVPGLHGNSKINGILPPVHKSKIQINSQFTFAELLKNQQLSFTETSEVSVLAEGFINDPSGRNINTGLLMEAIIVCTTADGGGHEITDGLNQLVFKYGLFDIGLLIVTEEKDIKVSIIGNPKTSQNNFVEQFEIHLVSLLQAIVANPLAQIGSFNLLSQHEFDLIVTGFNNTVTPYKQNKTIHNFFEEQVLTAPHGIALQKGTNYLTYEELNRKANQTAAHLLRHGLKPGENVGLIVNRGFDMIIGMLGILKAGGAYVPIDPEYPADRQHFILNHSLSRIILADDNYPVKDFTGERDYLVINGNLYEGTQHGNPCINIDSKQLAYTIYTSGSTGEPKGVMIAHHSVINLFSWVNKEFKVGPEDKLLFITSMCFDLSVYDIFGMLAAGGTIVIAEKKEIQNVNILRDMLNEYQITFWDSVPTTMDYLVKSLEKEGSNYTCNSLRTVFLSGDWIPVEMPGSARKFFPNTKVVSLGGATEGTVWSNFYVVEDVLDTWTSIPYGRPIDNNFFYILNDHLQPAPVGVAGDLYIGGVGVAHGYANDPQKTAYSFIPDPFNFEAGGMMYRTGDLGRMMPDYNMEFLGRKDSQVKINGFRVELGEIENVLKLNQFVDNAVVLTKNDKYGNKRLICYLVCKQHFNQDELIGYLKSKLPDYMIPVVWVKLEKLPLTSNGKIDRKSLLNVDDQAESPEIPLKPNTLTEKILLDIWRDYLNLNVLQINESFFELGGHSMMAVQMLSRFKKITNRDFQLAVLYQYPDIKSLAQFIDNEQKVDEFKYLVPIKATGIKDPLYIIQGDSGNILNFSNLIKYIDKEQPLYGLKAIGLDGVYASFDDLTGIAMHYISEIIKHNPSGPYLLAGYSSGAYVAVEMRKQMMLMGKTVDLLMIIDADAGMTEYKNKYKLLPKKIKRHYPELLALLKLPFLKLRQLKSGNLQNISTYLPFHIGKNTNGFSKEDREIRNKRNQAFKKYKMEPFNGNVYLLKAKISVHYVDYGRYLGWDSYAKKGVKLYELEGDHFSILVHPFVKAFTLILQQSLDEVTKANMNN